MRYSDLVSNTTLNEFPICMYLFVDDNILKIKELVKRDQSIGLKCLNRHLDKIFFTIMLNYTLHKTRHQMETGSNIDEIIGFH